MEFVLVNKETLRMLLERSMEYRAHEAAGVDNWMGRDDIQWPTDEEIDAELELLIIPA